MLDRTRTALAFLTSSSSSARLLAPAGVVAAVAAAGGVAAGPGLADTPFGVPAHGTERGKGNRPRADS